MLHDLPAAPRADTASSESLFENYLKSVERKARSLSYRNTHRTELLLFAEQLRREEAADKAIHARYKDATAKARLFYACTDTFVGAVRQTCFRLTASTARVQARAGEIRRRIAPFPHQVMSCDEFARLGHINVEKVGNREKREIKCKEWEAIALFIGGDDDRSLGATRQAKDGSMNTAIGLTLTHWRNLKENKLGIKHEHLDIVIVHAHLNKFGVLTTSQATLQVDEEDLRMYLCSLPSMFEDEGKEYNEEMAAICEKIVTEAWERGKAAGVSMSQSGAGSEWVSESDDEDSNDAAD